MFLKIFPRSENFLKLQCLETKIFPRFETFRNRNQFSIEKKMHEIISTNTVSVPKKLARVHVHPHVHEILRSWTSTAIAGGLACALCLLRPASSVYNSHLYIMYATNPPSQTNRNHKFFVNLDF